jgi:hypothetical protein
LFFKEKVKEILGLWGLWGLVECVVGLF